MLLIRGPIGRIEQLKHEWSSCDDAGAAGEKTSAHDAFEDGGFAARLAADDDYLGEVEGGVLAEGTEDVLKFRRYGDEFFHFDCWVCEQIETSRLVVVV